MTTAAAAQW